VEDTKGNIGFITTEILFNGILSGKVTQTDEVGKVLKQQCIKVNEAITIKELSQILQNEPNVVVINKQNNTFKGILTQIDFLNFIACT
jgi:predicted transcriptional regulator